MRGIKKILIEKEMTNMSKQINIKLNEEEFTAVTDYVRANDLNRNAWIKRMVLKMAQLEQQE